MAGMTYICKWYVRTGILLKYGCVPGIWQERLSPAGRASKGYYEGCNWLIQEANR
jgi:hypothetical protein